VDSKNGPPNICELNSPTWRKSTHTPTYTNTHTIWSNYETGYPEV